MALKFFMIYEIMGSNLRLNGASPSDDRWRSPPPSELYGQFLAMSFLLVLRANDTLLKKTVGRSQMSLHLPLDSEGVQYACLQFSSCNVIWFKEILVPSFANEFISVYFRSDSHDRQILGLGKIVVWFVLLPCCYTRKDEVWPHGMEYTLWFQ